MTRLPFVLASLALTAALSAQAQTTQTQSQTQQTQTTPPQTTPPAPAGAKPDVKVTATAAGKWNLSVDTDNGTMASVLEVKLDGKTVSGTLTGTQGTIPIQGDFTDGKLSFTMTFAIQDGSIDVSFAGALKDDDTLTGTATAGTFGTFPFTATRIKDKQ